MQIHAYWGQGFCCERNGNVVINTVAAHCDRSVTFAKDALLILIRMILPPALIISLPFLPLSRASSQKAELITEFRSKATRGFPK